MGIHLSYMITVYDMICRSQQFPSTRCQHFVWIDWHLSFSSASFQVLHTSPVPILGMIDELALTWRIDRGVRCGKHAVGGHSFHFERSFHGSGCWVKYTCIWENCELVELETPWIGIYVYRWRNGSYFRCDEKIKLWKRLDQENY